MICHLPFELRFFGVGLLAMTLGWILAPTKKLQSFFLFELRVFGVVLLAMTS
jgi:hypothetical protein